MDEISLPTGNSRLEALAGELWTLLENGRSDRRHGFHLPVVATADADGIPEARTVVLRSVDRARRLLGFHTDARSAKMLSLPTGAHVAWVFYDPNIKQQLRVRGRVCASTNPDEAWARTGLPSRRCYLVTPGPGTPIDAPEHGWVRGLSGVNPTTAESEPGREVFRQILTSVDHMDWLFLQARGHLRASLRWDAPTQEFVGSWVVP